MRRYVLLAVAIALVATLTAAWRQRWIAVAYFVWASRGIAPDTVVHRTVELGCLSPDSAAVATYFTEMGGGAAGFVLDYVSVRLAGIPLDHRHVVFESGLNRRAELRWRDARHLTVVMPESALLDYHAPSITLSPTDTVYIDYLKQRFEATDSTEARVSCQRGT